MEKRFLVFLLCAGFLGSCNSAAQSDFALSLYLKSEENSADAVSVIETLELDGTRGEYTSTYSDEDFELTSEQVESLKLFIEESALNQDLVEEKSVDESGRSVEMTLSIDMNGVSTEIKLAGMSETDGGPTNLENFVYIETAQDLISTVKDLGGLYNDQP